MPVPPQRRTEPLSVLPHTVADFVLGAAERDGASPDRVVLVDGRRRVTWAELDRAVRTRAAGLRQLGLDAGDRVVLQLGTGVDFVEVYLGALHAGLVAVPVNPAYTVPELHYVLADCAARALVTSSVGALTDLDRLRAELPTLEFVVSAAGSDPSDGVVALSSLTGAEDAP